MDYTVWAEKYLRHSFFIENDCRVSLYASELSTKPVIVLVHGISGDHNGLVPLAAELVTEYRVVLIDLPGHGRSDATALQDAAALQKWFLHLMDHVKKKFGPVRYVAAHSFGCSAVLTPKVLGQAKVVLINPVPTPSLMYARYARIIMNSAHFWAHIYNWRLFILLRGMTLAKYRTHESMRRVRWVGWTSKASYAQIVFQAGLVDIILDTSAYENAKNGAVAAVICGMSDTTAHERDSLDMERVFGMSRSVFIRGGHLLPIESPASVAGVLKEIMVE